MIPFSVIVAADEKGGIGKDGILPWRLPSDLKSFKEITTATGSSGTVNFLVMGRKTWESLPERFRPLPGRINCVITRQAALDLPVGVLKAADLDAALALAQSSASRVEQVFVIGGAQIYQLAFAHPGCRTIYWTRILCDCGCDTFIPVDLSGYEKISETPPQNENGIPFCFAEYRRLPLYH